MSKSTCRAAQMLLLILGLLSAASLAEAQPQGGVYKVIKVEGRKAGAASSDGVLAGNTLYLAAQDGRGNDGTLPASIAQETAQALAHMREVLRAAGMDMGNLVWVQVYVSRYGYIAEMNDSYWKSIGPNPPARTVLVAAGLPGLVRVQINAIAVGNSARRRVISPAGRPHSRFTDPAGIQADDVLYISGQSGADPRTGKLPADYGEEVKQSLENVGAVLKAANMTMANVLWTNPYMASPDAGGPQGTSAVIAHNGQPQQAQVTVMNKVYASYFEFGNTPGRGTIEVSALPTGAHIVFTAIAGADLSQRKSIRPKNMAPSPTASPGILYRDTYYMSGKSGFIPDQGIVTQDVALQLRQSMRNLLDDLQESDMDFSDVVSAIVYVRDIADADKVQALYGTFFKGAFPARTTLQNSFDQKTATAEQISFIAVRQPRH